jgi:hypothetical protein
MVYPRYSFCYPVNFSVSFFILSLSAMTIIKITGPANTGKSELASRLNGIIVDSDRIRHGLHAAQKPSHTHAILPEWSTAFDSPDGGRLLDAEGINVMTKEQLITVGGPWAWSAEITKRYILNLIRDAGPDELYIITGQFQLNKRSSIELDMELAQRGAIFIYVYTPLDICQARHVQSKKNYPVEDLEKYWKNNRPLHDIPGTLTGWFSDAEWVARLSPEEHQILSNQKVHILSGCVPLDQNIAVLRQILRQSSTVVVPLRLNSKSNSNSNPAQVLRSKSDPIAIGDNLPHFTHTDAFAFHIFPVDTILTGAAARASLVADVQDFDKTRVELDTGYIRAAQADITELTRQGFPVSPTINPSLFAALTQEYSNGNILLHGGRYHIGDYIALMRAAGTAPLTITLPKEARPPAHVIVDMAAHPERFNGYDIPIAELRADGTLVSSVPEAYRPFQTVLETAVHVLMALHRLNENPDDALFLLSHQSVPLIPPGKAGSLESLHYDNILTPADQGGPGVRTCQFPTILLIYEVDAQGVYIDDLMDRDSMGTEIYSHTQSDTATELKLISAAGQVQVDRHFAPAEGAGILLKYAPEHLRLHKGGNGDLLLFNHLHKAVKNNKSVPITRSQWRLMAVQRSQSGFKGYAKQSNNIALNALLGGTLNHQERSGCYERYSHPDAQGIPVVRANCQTHVQTYGFSQAVHLGLVETLYKSYSLGNFFEVM